MSPLEDPVMAQLKDFQGIEGSNFFEEDQGFKSLLAGLLPEEERAPVFASLAECGRLAGGRWNDLARDASRPEQAPRIVKRDRVGNPVERIDFGPLTAQLRYEVADFGVLTRARSDLHRFGMIYLIAHNGEASLTCPISCTDGLIRAIESQGPNLLHDCCLPMIRSADTPFGGAQFVTERAGGSDVGAIETTALPDGEGGWSITGEKWFCSNPDEFFLVAARRAGAGPGTAGIGVFLVPRVLPDGQLNRVRFHRLKDKLGTRSLPTAEMSFDGATGYAIGEPADGFKTLMNCVINVSRIHNAVNACGFLRRAFLEARNYARQREAFGKPIIEYPLVQETLVSLLERLWRARLLTFKLIATVDKRGLVPKDPEQAMWQRFLINLSKYRTAATLTESIKQAILLLGANGVVEDFSVLPRLLRDAMVIETWEGPHNTLCLQIVRDAARSSLLERWQSEVARALDAWPHNLLSFTRVRLEQGVSEINDLITSERIRNSEWAEAHARRLVDRLGSLLEIAWMAEAAARHSGEHSTPAAGHSNEDSTAALLTAAARYYLLPGERLFDHPVMEALREHGLALIDETRVHADVSRL
jgi:alkylation response protein AidB-like acyl-CoA dehydrogenase